MRDNMDFSALPIDSSESCVTSLIVAIEAAVFSSDNPALCAIDAVLVNAVPMPSASDEDSKSMLDKISFT